MWLFWEGLQTLPGLIAIGWLAVLHVPSCRQWMRRTTVRVVSMLDKTVYH